MSKEEKVGKFTNFMMKTENPKKQPDELTKIDELLADEIRAVLEELNFEHSDTDKYTKSVANLNALTKAYSDVLKADSEKLKLALQVAEAKKKRFVNYDVVIPKVASLFVYGGLMGFWICIEQQRPTPIKLINMANQMLMPKGL